ncbi:MAG TPA: hypothetical protein VHE13_03680 [Opitutus sp.]|nr:hypothetical protein [Opitutus sp.]
MSIPSLSKLAAALLCLGPVAVAAAADSPDSVVTAVFSRSFNNYERPVGPNGAPVIQTYVMAKGGYAPGLGKDPSIDDVKFAGIVRVLGKYLAKQGYYPAKDAQKADLMLVVHWGKTVPFSDGVQRNLLDDGLRSFADLQQLGKGIGGAPGSKDVSSQVPPSAATFGAEEARLQAEAAVQEAATEEMVQGLYQVRESQNMRVDADTYNANLLGYTNELKKRDNPTLYGGAGTTYYDLLGDLESERYYVALTAYDFQEAVRHQNKKGLWRTVTSIDARGNRFDEKLAKMIDKASHYFGQDTGRLVRDFEYTPHVDLGEMKVLGVVDDNPKAKK